MPIFRWINEFLNRDFLAHDGRNQSILLADAGMGKTSLLLMLKLLHINAMWPQQKKCVLLKLGEDTLDVVKAIKGKDKTILLLDALDEDPVAVGNIKSRLVDLLAATQVFDKVIISCRTQYLPEGDYSPFDHLGRIHVSGYTCPTLFISLFDDNQVREYLRKRFPRAPKKQAHGERIIGMMGSLRSRPLLLSYIEDFMEAGEHEWDEYTIYLTLTEAWLKREERKFRKYLKREVPWQQLLEICVRTSIYLQRKLEQSLIPEDLDRLIDEDERFSLLSKLDIGGRSLLNRNSEGAYRFSHYTIQEFLISFAVVNNCFGDDELTRATSQIMDFLKPFDWKKTSINRLYFDGLELNGVKFEDLEMPEASFDGCTLKNVIFRNVIMIKSRFSGVKLIDCKFVKSKLSNCSFRDASIRGCSLEDSDFSECDFWGSTLENCQILHADFPSTNFERSTFKKCFSLECKFNDSVFDYADLSGSRYDGCEFIGVSTDKSELRGTIFVGVDIDCFNEDSTDLSVARFG